MFLLTRRGSRRKKSLRKENIIPFVQSIIILFFFLKIKNDKK